MKSLSEIDTTSKRASRAAGYSWGISEEVGKNIRMLEMFGLPGIKNLNDYYKRKKERKFENLNLISADNKIVKSEFCPIIAGTSFLDQIKSLENLNEINFEKIAYPLLFLPFVSRASEIIGKKLLQKLDEKGYLEYEKYHGINLTEKGNKIAHTIRQKHGILLDFFEILGVGNETANQDAEGVEHHLNPKTIRQLRKFITFLKSNPKITDEFNEF